MSFFTIYRLMNLITSSILELTAPGFKFHQIFFSDSRQKFGINLKPVQYPSSGQSKEVDGIFSLPRELRIPALSFASLQLSLSPGKPGYGGTH